MRDYTKPAYDLFKDAMLPVMIVFLLTLVCIVILCGQETLRLGGEGSIVPVEEIVAASCSLLDVSNAVVTATNGQTVVIPAGDCTWDGPLIVTEGLIFRGAGTNTGSSLTKITRTGGDIIVFSSESVSNRTIGVFDLFLRFDNFQTTNDKSVIKIDRPNSQAKLCQDFRISRCKFEFGQRTIYTWGYGVVDHCHFIDANGEFHPRFDIGTEALDHLGEEEWNKGLRLGTTNTLVVEDCVFISTAAAAGRNQETVYGQYGSRCIFRRNIIRQSGSSTPFMVWDAHGRGQEEDWRGTIAYEFSNNDVAWTAATSFIMGNFRGGTILACSNIFNGPGPTYMFILKDEGWSTYMVASTNDWVTNSFFWDNSFNGNTNQSQLLTVEAGSETFVQEDVDYSFRKPQAGDVIHPYVMLQYPHPRVARGDF